MGLLGREAERERLEALVDDARLGRTGALIVGGEAGIGKTSLLEAAAAAAGDFDVLRARGIEAESELPYAALLELLRPQLHGLEQLPAPLREALAGALALGPRAGDAFAIAAATAALLVSSAERHPVLLVVDDLQWVDRPSAAAIAFTARRVHGVSLVVLLSLRAPPAPPVGLDGIERLAVRPLDESAANELVARHGVPHSLRAKIVREAAGNPLALVELARSPSGVESGGQDVAERLFGRDVDALDEVASTALLVAAVDTTGDADVIAAAAGGADRVRRLERSGLAYIRGGRLALRHPLLRSLVLGRAWEGARRDAHKRLAAALPDGDERTRHLALATVAPDAELAHELVVMATRSTTSGSVWLLERAAALTPDAADRARRQLAAAHAAFAARDIAAAERLFAGSLATDDGLLNAERTELEARLMLIDGNLVHGAELLEQLGLRLAADDPLRAARLLIDAVAPLAAAGHTQHAANIADRARALAPPDDPALLLLAESGWAESRLWLGRWPEADNGYRRAALHAEEHGLHADPTARLALAEALHSGGLQDRARELATAAARAARRDGALGDLHNALAILFSVEFACGRIAPAAAAATEELELAVGLGRLMEHKEGLGHLAWCAAHSRDEETCRRLVDERYRLSELLGDDAMLHPALGVLELGLGNAEAAVAAFRRIARTYTMRGHGGAILPFPIAADLAEALLRAGRPDEARAVVEAFECEARFVERPLSLSLAHRCRGLLADDDSFDVAFETALALDEGEPRPLERARTLLCWGERLRRAKRRSAAREKLNDAHDELDRLGSRLWAARAQAELAATGQRARRRDPATLGTLTPQEQHVANLVAEGLTNREVAIQLFVSTNTIETHLRHIFQKLGVRSRIKLARTIDGSREGAAAAGRLPA